MILPVIMQTQRDLSVAITKHTEDFAVSSDDNELLSETLATIVDLKYRDIYWTFRMLMRDNYWLFISTVLGPLGILCICGKQLR